MRDLIVRLSCRAIAGYRQQQDVIYGNADSRFHDVDVVKVFQTYVTRTVRDSLLEFVIAMVKCNDAVL